MGSNERGGSSSSSSSRKGKKSSNSDKPKPPQRGLGVAQLEKIRLHGHVPSSSTPTFHPPLPHPHPHLPSFNHQEEMRLQTSYNNYAMMPASCFAYASTSASPITSYGYHPNFMTEFGEHERTNIRYGDHYQPTTSPSWNTRNGMVESQHFAPTNYTRQFLDPNLQDSQENSESSDSQELDLELRL